MPTVNLKNITIVKKDDKNFKTYYLIINNDNQDEAYFCFEGTVEKGWDNLVNNWENLKEVEIEYKESSPSSGQSDKIYRHVIVLSSADDMFI